MKIVKLWEGPPLDQELPDSVVVILNTPRQATELYARVKSVAEQMEATGKVGTLEIHGRIRQ